METTEFDTLLQFFKVMGSEKRLRIIGLLANKAHTVGELARALDLSEPTVSEHLNTLRGLELVHVRAEGTKRFYTFNPTALHRMNKDFFSSEALKNLAPPMDDDAKILARLFDGDRLRRIPSGRKNLLLVLQFLAAQFEEDRQYPEKEVNAILTRHHEDFATLRRELVDFHYMARKNNIYWRLPMSNEPPISMPSPDHTS